MDEIDRVLTALAQHHGLAVNVLEKYSKGESGGTYRVVDTAGRHLVLKRSSAEQARRAQATTERLRQRGYPATIYEHIVQIEGDSWVLVAELAGRPLDALTVGLVDQLLQLIERQAGEALLPPHEQSIVDTLLVGGHGYAVHDTMRSHSSVTSQLLDEVIEIGRQYEGLDYPMADIVHYDLNPANILALDGRITGIVDWESTQTGDRAFDIATLLYYADSDPAVEHRLSRELLDSAGPARASVYIAHMILRQVEWSVRHHHASTIQHHINRSNALMQTIASW